MNSFCNAGDWPRQCITRTTICSVKSGQKKAAERTDTLRLILWFPAELKVAVDHRLKVDMFNRREAAEKAALIARGNARAALLNRLQLTQEQRDLLGIRVVLGDDQPQ